MPRAEVGSTKHLANKMKSKGLQRLRWYCQVCEKQCRDENGFKCHTQSESHVRAMQTVGSNARAAIADYSGQFERDFVRQLRTTHGTKPVIMNRFYQEYIAFKEHVHMNATRWSSLTEFAKHLGREGICRVEEDDKGLHVSWIDNSPAALRRQAALQKRERQDKGDEELEQQLIREQIARAQADATSGDGELVKGEGSEDKHEAELESRQLKRVEGERITLSFGAPKASESQSPPKTAEGTTESATASDSTTPSSVQAAPSSANNGSAKISLGLSSTNGAPKPKNVFAAASRKAANPLAAGAKKGVPAALDAGSGKRMSEAERIMREELERKRKPAGGQHQHAMGVGFGLGGGAKRQRVG